MATTPINSIGLAPSGGAPKILDGTPAAAAESFGKALADAVEGLRRVQGAADQQVNRLAAGEPVELHNVMMAIEQANLTFQLALQVRNKVLEAYQEINRMQM